MPRTVPVKRGKPEPTEAETKLAERKKKLKLPEENILYFIEKNSPTLDPWKRELLRIVRNIAQYFYPQKQTRVMNEGCATFVHHYIVNALYEKGLLSDGSMLEFNHMHSNVLFQPDFDDPRCSGLNPYALGFAMMCDIRRISTEPSDEDREWFPAFAGKGDWRDILKDAWANYRDESFIQQFLSPKLIRDFRMFVLADKQDDSHYTVEAIHDERGYRRVRETLAQSYDIGCVEPDIQVVDVDVLGERRLVLHHKMRNGVPLAEKSRNAAMDYLRFLWGYDVTLCGINAESGARIYEVSANEGRKSDHST